MESEAHMFKAERARARQSWRENVFKAELTEAEERERRDEIEGEEHLLCVRENLRKAKEYRTNNEVEVREMEIKTNKALEELRVDHVRFLPEESSDVLVRELMGQFAKLREKGGSLEEVLTLRMQDKEEVTAAIEKIQDTQKRTDMQGCHKDATTKLKIHS